MKRWWTADEQLMNWWWTADELMMNSWWTDDELMMNYHGLPQTITDYHRLPQTATDWLVVLHWTLKPISGMFHLYYIPDSTYYKSTASGANNVCQCQRTSAGGPPTSATLYGCRVCIVDIDWLVLYSDIPRSTHPTAWLPAWWVVCWSGWSGGF